jgi:hypothetical protein
MMSAIPVQRGLRFAGIVGCCVLCGVGLAASPSNAPVPNSAGTHSGAPRVVSPAGEEHSQRGELFYRKRWGIDMISVRSRSSGSSLEFRYRVVDPSKAAILSDTKLNPVLIHEKSGAKLSVPQMENVGALRQTAPPEEGKQYWMLFQDTHRSVKVGDRVDFAIGPVHLNALTVE